MSDATAVTATAVQEIVRLAERATTVQEKLEGGYIFTDRPLIRLNIDPALPPTLEFYTLGAFAAYLQAEYADNGPLVHVVSPLRVDAVSKLSGQDSALRRKPASAVCKSAVLHGWVGFNTFDSLEALNIALQTCFAQDQGDVLELRKFCASVRSTQSVGTDDDGVSQTVEAKRGIAAVQTTAVHNPWHLAPWRTFAEVQQPVSAYVLRFAQETAPEAGLFETGDARWQVEAVQAIAAFLRGALGPSWDVLG